MSTREIARLITSHRQREGAGFIVRRPLPSAGFEQLDPFLLIDEMGPADYAPGEAVGAPDHPHRGFETVTYVLDGEFEHEDSAGHRGTLRAGDVQWMTAGGGIIHSEEPSRKIREQGGRVHGFQIWVNLPAKLKMTRPRYQEVPSESIPTVSTADGKATGRIIAGEALGTRAVIDTHTPIVFQDWTLEPDADVSVQLSSSQSALIFVFRGEARIGDANADVREGQLAVLGPGQAVRLRGPMPGAPTARALLLAGVPLNEPVVRYGPFVMNTRQEILAAMADYQSGRMGEIVRTAQIG